MVDATANSDTKDADARSPELTAVLYDVAKLAFDHEDRNRQLRSSRESALVTQHVPLAVGMSGLVLSLQGKLASPDSVILFAMLLMFLAICSFAVSFVSLFLLLTRKREYRGLPNREVIASLYAAVHGGHLENAPYLAGVREYLGVRGDWRSGELRERAEALADRQATAAFRETLAQAVLDAAAANSEVHSNESARMVWIRRAYVASVGLTLSAALTIGFTGVFRH